MPRSAGLPCPGCLRGRAADLSDAAKAGRLESVDAIESGFETFQALPERIELASDPVGLQAHQARNRRNDGCDLRQLHERIVPTDRMPRKMSS